MTRRNGATESGCVSTERVAGSSTEHTPWTRVVRLALIAAGVCLVCVPLVAAQTRQPCVAGQIIGSCNTDHNQLCSGRCGSCTCTYVQNVQSSVDCGSCPPQPSCSTLGGDYCSNTSSCPYSYSSLGASSDCAQCCKSVGPSCGGAGGDYCSNTGSCPNLYDSLGQTYDCNPCCKSSGPSCGGVGGDYCSNTGACPSGYGSLGQTYDCNPCCKTQPCGNGTCDAGENCGTCPGDCPCPSGQHCSGSSCVADSSCGNGTCEPGKGENCGNCGDCACSADKTCQNGTCVPHCGDGTCDPSLGEHCSNCPQDCGTCQRCTADTVVGTGTQCSAGPEVLCVGYCGSCHCMNGTQPMSLECPSCPVSPRCADLGATVCASGSTCPQGTEFAGYASDCGRGVNPCCKGIGPSCGEKGGTQCSGTEWCPPGHFDLGQTYDCTRCCKLGTCVEQGGDYCTTSGACQPGDVYLTRASDCEVCCQGPYVRGDNKCETQKGEHCSNSSDCGTCVPCASGEIIGICDAAVHKQVCYGRCNGDCRCELAPNVTSGINCGACPYTPPSAPTCSDLGGECRDGSTDPDRSANNGCGHAYRLIGSVSDGSVSDCVACCTPICNHKDGCQPDLLENCSLCPDECDCSQNNSYPGCVGSHCGPLNLPECETACQQEGATCKTQCHMVKQPQCGGCQPEDRNITCADYVLEAPHTTNRCCADTCTYLSKMTELYCADKGGPGTSTCGDATATVGCARGDSCRLTCNVVEHNPRRNTVRSPDCGFFCGDGVCEGPETCQNCEQDCGLCPYTNEHGLRVLTYNLNMLPNTLFTQCSHCNERAALIAANPYLKTHDVIVFQEAFEDDARRILLDALLPQYPHQTPVLDGDSPVPPTITNGGVVIVSRWPIDWKESTVYSVCGLTSDQHTWGDCHGPKGVWGALIDKIGDLYYVFGTHLQSGYNNTDQLFWQVRQTQLRQMEGFVRSEACTGVPKECVAGTPIGACIAPNVCDNHCGFCACVRLGGPQFTYCGACPPPSGCNDPVLMAGDMNIDRNDPIVRQNAVPPPPPDGYNEYLGMQSILLAAQPPITCRPDICDATNGKGNWYDYILSAQQPSFIPPTSANNSVLHIQNPNAPDAEDGGIPYGPNLSDHQAVFGDFDFSNLYGRQAALRASAAGLSTAAMATSADAQDCTSLPELAVPIPVGPSGTVSSNVQRFSWQEVAGAERYHLEVNEVASGASIRDVTIRETSFTPNTFVVSGQQYVWRVSAVRGSEQGPACADQFFTYEESDLSAPVALAPVGTIEGDSPTFAWSDVPGAEYYVLSVVGVATGEVVEGGLVPPGAAFVVDKPLVPGQEYRWKIRAVRGTEAGPESEELLFTCNSASGLEAPKLIGPMGNVEGGLPVFSWNDVDGADSYWVQVVSNQTGAPVLEQTVTGTSFTPSAPLVTGLRYHWQARALKAGIGSPSSAIMAFRCLAPNRTPSLAVSGCSECAVFRSVKFTAFAGDPDHDHLRYTWSGCAAGGVGPTAICSLTAPGPLVATVTVSDGRGGTATASATVVGRLPLPTVSINDVSLAEGNSGTTNATFTVTLSNAADTTVTVDFATANGSAVARGDYLAQAGTLTFAPGETTKTIAVPVIGDTAVEPDETFFVNLSNPSPAAVTIARPQGVGTIRNDDVLAPVPVFWRNVVGVTASGNSLTKTAATGWGNAGAASVQQIAGDGYMEFTVQETNTYRLAGLSNGDTNQQINDVDFAVYLANDTVKIFEGGVNRGDAFVTIAGDRYRIVVESGVVKYYRNGTLFYTSTVAPTCPLGIDTTFFNTDSTIKDATIYAQPGPAGPPHAVITAPTAGRVGTALTFAGLGSWDPDGAVVSYAWSFGDGATATGATVTHIYSTSGPHTVTLTVTDNSGLTGSATQVEKISEPVVWKNLVGVIASGNSLTKTAEIGWNNGGASSVQMMTGDGYVEFTVQETNTYRMAGLSNGDTNQTPSDIDFAVNLVAGTLKVTEAGVFRAEIGAFSAGDRFRVAVESGVVKYYQNGTLFYASTVSPTFPLGIDTSLCNTDSTIKDATIYAQ